MSRKYFRKKFGRQGLMLCRPAFSTYPISQKTGVSVSSFRSERHVGNIQLPRDYAGTRNLESQYVLLRRQLNISIVGARLASPNRGTACRAPTSGLRCLIAGVLHTSRGGTSTNRRLPGKAAVMRSVSKQSDPCVELSVGGTADGQAIPINDRCRP